MGTMEINEKEHEESMEDWLSSLKEKAKSGDTDAMLELARHLDNNDLRLNKESFEWIKKACELGNIRAYVLMSDIYSDSKDVSYDVFYHYNRRSRYAVQPDKKQSMDYLMKAYKAGYPLSPLSLSLRYLLGVDVDIDKSKAFEYALEATKTTKWEGKYLLALYYREGIGTKKDIYKAIELLKSIPSKDDYQENLRLLEKIYSDKDSPVYDLEKAKEYGDSYKMRSWLKGETFRFVKF